ncbi:MAG: L,D-transpeptidase YcbB [Pseudomonadota bacterium]|nr:L,D-transpeptidase YcbB [Pseudomonadota bacterium]
MQKMLVCLRWFFLFAMLSTARFSFASDYSDGEVLAIKTQLTGSPLICAPKLRCGASSLLANFYNQQKYTPVWTDDGGLTHTGKAMINVLRTAYTDGLDPRSYHIKQINSLMSRLTAADDDNRDTILAALELTISDGFLLYANNLYYGMLDVKKTYPYWNNVKKPIDLIKQLELAADDPAAVAAKLVPSYPGYSKLKDKLAQYQEVEANGGWPVVPGEDVLKIGDSGEAIKLLRKRLYISGELANLGGSKFDNELQNAVIQFQENNGVYYDGVVEGDTLAALNVSAKTRIRQIELNLDKMRLLPDDMSKDYLFINLPAYSLNVVHDGSQIMVMDIAVGGSEHPSCVLNSKIQYLVLNPYWNIPAQIAESEIWASVRANSNYLKDKHVQVLKKDSSGNYKEIDSSGFNWNKMTAKQFNSYRYRQAPYEQNALGKVKFIFPNACGIYLHSTNESELFDVYARDFSHGCIRVSQPLNLTTFMLNSQKQWSIKKVADMYQNDVNKTVPLVKPFNLYIMYLTAFVGDDDWTKFRQDIYKFDKKLLSKYSGFMPPKSDQNNDSDPDSSE